MAGKRARRAVPPRDPQLDEQIRRMRDLLRLMSPETGSSALGAIRKAFPEVPLAARVAAVSEYRGQPPEGEAALLLPAPPLRAASA